MRSKRNICLWCQHAAKTINSSGSVRTYVSSRPKDYVLSPLVIELDAADSKFVRAAEESDSDTYEPFLGSPAGMEGLKPEKSIITSESKLKKDGPRFNLATATAPDLLSYVLLGANIPDSIQPHGNKSPLRLIYSANGIHPGSTAKHHLQTLLYDFTKDVPGTLSRAGFNSGLVGSTVEDIGSFWKLQGPLIKAELRACKSFSRLRRLTSIIAQAYEGCEFLSLNGKDIIKGIRNCRREQLDGSYRYSLTDPAPVWEVQTYLNDLCLNMRSKGLDIGPDMCNAAIYYSAKSYILPAVRMHLHTALEKSHRPNTSIIVALKKLIDRAQEASSRPIHKLWNAWRVGNFSRQDVLTLLTGWELGGIPSIGEERGPCFATLLRPYHNTYVHYILNLGSFGASDALWYEWSNLDDPATSPTMRGPENRRRSAEIFSMALLMAKDTQRAREIRRSFISEAGNLSSPDNSLQGFLGVEATKALTASTGAIDDALYELRKELINDFSLQDGEFNVEEGG